MRRRPRSSCPSTPRRSSGPSTGVCRYRDETQPRCAHERASTRAGAEDAAFRSPTGWGNPSRTSPSAYRPIHPSKEPPSVEIQSFDVTDGPDKPSDSTPASSREGAEGGERIDLSIEEKAIVLMPSTPGPEGSVEFIGGLPPAESPSAEATPSGGDSPSENSPPAEAGE